MYLPPHFEARDPAIAHDVVRAHPLATLVSTDDDGLPFVTHLPLHLEVGQGGGADVLWGHVARPNPHWRLLQARPRALVSVLGPQAYLSPRVYPDLARVPSWNYIAVAATVEARLVDDADDKDSLLKCLIADHEPAYAAQWRAMDAGLAQRMLAGIVGLELRVLQWRCKLKINQHRPEAHARQHAIYAAGGEQERALARWMERLGCAPVPTAPEAGT